MKIYKRFVLFLFILLYLLTACSNAEEPVHQVVQATFSDGQGNTLEYYAVTTTYPSGSPKAAVGLNTGAFHAVFDLDSAALIKEFDTCGHPTAIYQSQSRSYLCCTASPTASAILSYDPNAVSEADMIRTVQSIFQQQDSP